MVRRSFRIGLRIGLLAGLLAAAVKLVQSRRSSVEVAAPTPTSVPSLRKPEVAAPTEPAPADLPLPAEAGPVLESVPEPAPAPEPEPPTPLPEPPGPEPVAEEPPAAPAKAAPVKKAAKKKAAPARAWIEPVGDTCPGSHPVKGKLSSGIFHPPGMLAYNRTKPDRCYKDEQAAEGDGLRKAKR